MNLKNLDYEIVPVHLVRDGGEQNAPQFLRLNPAQRVPVLEHAGQVIAQSVAIIEYLEAIFRETHLYPTRPFERALARQLCETINSDIQPLQNLSVLRKLVQDHGFSENEINKWVQHWITRGLQTAETLMKETAGEYAVGDKPSVVDCFLVPQIFNAQRYQVELNTFPTIQRVNEKCLRHPAFIKAHPFQQPDTPEELRPKKF
jgi:maleylacetoacetate isomerase